MVIWTTSTGDAGEATTRPQAAHAATEAVLAHWGRQHPRTGGAEGVRICVDDTDTYAAPARDHDGHYDPTETTAMMTMVREHLAQPTPTHDTGELW